VVQQQAEESVTAESVDETGFVQVAAQDCLVGLSREEARAYVLAAGGALAPERLSDEQPEQRVHLAAFSLARAPVTCALYQRFVEEGYGERKLFRELQEDFGPRAHELRACFVDETGRPGPSCWRNGRYPQGKEGHPVEGISFYEATACARFFNARLPSEAEWEAAARLPDQRHFPWGNALPSATIANFSWNHVGGTSPVGEFAAGASALGLLDLAGNVHEWTSSRYEAYVGGVTRRRFAGTELARVARGGAHNGDLWDLRTTSRFGVEPLSRFGGLGMRFAR
jgi:gamma-glutamyl hercynylcysteine S-oxide synthase